MAIFDSNINYQNLIQITGGTIRIASFVEIRDALTQQFKNIYGSDIDVSSATADGQYINSLALILNNILQTVKFAFDSLDPAVATGKYLDVLCSYNNIQRINATNSVAQIYIYNPTNVTITVSNLQFVDRSGIIWIWKNEQLSDGTNLISFPPGEVTILDNVVCNELGPIEAQGYKFIDSNGDTTDDVSQNDWSQPCPAWINQFVNETSLQLWQYKDAVVGNEEETDEALRSRRYLMLGNQSVSVLEGLQGTLEQLSGIKDVCIINNFNGDNLIMSAPTNDGTNVLGHSIYIALRYKEGVNIDASTIGKLIYNRMTPGIGTTPYGLNTSNPSGQSTAPEYQSFVIQKTDTIQYTIFWKKCSSISPQITIQFLCNSNYNFPSTLTSHTASTEVETNIVTNLQNYINDVNIDTYLQSSRLLNAVQTGDIQKFGVSTFFVQSCIIGSDENTQQNYPANLSYFSYDDSDFKFAYSDNLCTLTIG